MKKAFITLLVVLILLIVAIGTIFVVDIEPMLELVGDEQIEINYGNEYEDMGATAYLVEQHFGITLIPVNVNVQNNIQNTQLGIYKVTYQTKFLYKSIEIERTVVVVDKEPPTIELVEQQDNALTIPGEKFKETGFKAIDNVDGDITNKVESKELDGKVIYIVTDSSGNTTKVERIIKYKDIEPPTITLVGSINQTLKVGETYNEFGYVAEDNVDGDLSNKVVVTNNIDTNTPGMYEIIYSVEDSSGNKAEEKRKITVLAPQQNNPTANGDKVIYLTFDDGPGQYTEKLLNILDEYNVKVTFFVTNQYPKYRDLIGEAYRRGHTVAIHTYTHDYSKIYKSKDAYYEDLNKMQEIIVEQTGSPTNLFRFPGGSSNTVSRSYCDGIMTKLSKDLQDDGYHYFDWNVSSGDAGETTQTSKVVENVINGCSQHNISVVLQHDIKGFSVDAVKEIIEWGLTNGYQFRGLDENSPTAHHGINN